MVVFCFLFTFTVCSFTFSVLFIRIFCPVHLHSLSRSFAFSVPFVCILCPVRLHSLSRSFASSVPFVCILCPIRLHSLSRSFAFFVLFVHVHGHIMSPWQAHGCDKGFAAEARTMIPWDDGACSGLGVQTWIVAVHSQRSKNNVRKGDSVQMTTRSKMWLSGARCLVSGRWWKRSEIFYDLSACPRPWLMLCAHVADQFWHKLT